MARKLVDAIRAGIADPALYDKLRCCEPAFWANPRHGSSLAGLPFTAADLTEAHARWERLAPLIAHLFPKEAPEGRVRSALVPIKVPIGLGAGARALLKADCDLPIASSIKARGGLYEVFCRAEEVAIERKLLSVTDDYRKLASAPLQELLREEEVAVGSTGNLGMSVGLAAAGLGMKATIHMSTDAKAWKKRKLREAGVTVVEHAGQYSLAVAEGRKVADANPRCHFVDDEASRALFLGYACAARELAGQLREQGIEVSAAQPLVVYVPCGVGGAPGGICWGLKQEFGDKVFVYFGEPTHAPCVTLSLASGLGDKVCVQDLGLDGVTEADGLAVGRASGLVCDVVGQLVAGTFTVDDEELFPHLAALLDVDGRFMEPSCCAGLLGPARMRADPKAAELLERGTHVFWATGGAMVPEAEREEYYRRGKKAPEQIGSRL